MARPFKNQIKIYPERNCKTCGRVFTSKLTTDYLDKRPNMGWYCSSGCRSLAHRKPLVKINCAVCGKERLVQASTFKHSKVQYCSKKCGGKAFSMKFSGENHPFWKGDRATSRKFRTDSQPYRKWRKAVITRDMGMCIWCGSTKEIEVDHIKPKSLYPELVFDVNNGRTLCHDCHIKTPTHSKNLTKEQFESML